MNSTENYRCKLCGTPGRLWAKGKGFNVLRCPGCGLLWVDRVNTEPGDYWAEEIYLEVEKELEARFRRILSRVLRITGRPGRALEVGSSIGTFLKVAGEMGFEAEGCDISPRAVEFSRKRGLKVRLGTLDGAYREGEFDYVFAFNLVEHLPEPSLFFKNAIRVLKKGGFLVIETPIQDSLFHISSRFFYILSGGRLKFLGLSPDDHLLRFSRKTFRKIEEIFGLRLLRLWQMPSPWGEIWGKSRVVKMEKRLLYRAALPPLWFFSWVSGLGNRALAVFQKPL